MLPGAGRQTRSTPKPTARGATAGPREAVEIHTHILRLALGIEESRAYWAHVDPCVPIAARPQPAFEQRWFGAKSLERVRTLLANFAVRYDAFPEALDVLRGWRDMDPLVRQLVCHWHLQLADPIYRRFTGMFLPERRASASPKVDRDAVLRWVKHEFPGRWAEATCIQFASKLLSAASEAALVSPKRDPRALFYPKIPDAALGYLLHLLRGVSIDGTIADNPYLASVGLTDTFLDQRLLALPGITFRRMGTLTEFDWSAPTLSAWAEAQP